MPAVVQRCAAVFAAPALEAEHLRVIQALAQLVRLFPATLWRVFSYCVVWRICDNSWKFCKTKRTSSEELAETSSCSEIPAQWLAISDISIISILGYKIESVVFID